MKKLVLCSYIFIFGVFCFAGDAASFVDIGFSTRGDTYIFGQYGKTDVDFQSWAQIFFVDVKNNVFLKDGVFDLPPQPATKSTNGFGAYQKLKQSASSKIQSFSPAVATNENTLYLMEDENKSPTATITFKDFKNSSSLNPVSYKVTLQPSFYGAGENCQSSFVIDLKKTLGDGNVIFSKQVGTPSVKRKGVTGYRIIKIFSNKDNTGLVFVVEKTIQTKYGKNIRYMVETCSTSD